MRTTRPFPRARTRAALVVAGAGTLLLATSATAGAHVTVTPSTTAAGAYSVLTFSVGHGCDGSPTTEMVVRMPETVMAVTPTINPGWSVEKQMETLDEPVDDGHGGQYTERVAQVVYTADAPLAEGYRDTFELQLQLPGEEGDRLVFPVLQGCETGGTDWVQTYEEGQEEPELPAPFIELTAAEGEGHHGGVESESESETEHEEVSVSETSDGGTSTVAWIGLVLGALGLAAGGTALARPRR
jgi:uncharacterized protein YcnI